MTETWKAVPGYEGLYEVSNTGQVRSLGRVTGARNGKTRVIKPRILEPTPDGWGYPRVTLTDADGKCAVRKVHRLVMLAFVGPLPEGLMTRHLNGDCTDNRLENLAYGTGTENQLDRLAHGTNNKRNSTRCPHGHPYSGENLVWMKRKGGRPYRACRDCINRWQREKYHRRRATGWSR